MCTGYHYPPKKLVPYLQRAGFYGVSRVGHIVYDHSLVSALVERWRPETHTFHMPQGECTITLQDVAVQLGLPIDGQPVISRIPQGDHQTKLFEELLGKVPTTRDMRGNKIRLSWLVDKFPDNDIPENASPQVLEQWTRAYIMKLIGGFLCPYNTGSHVTCHMYVLNK